MREKQAGLAAVVQTAQEYQARRGGRPTRWPPELRQEISTLVLGGVKASEMSRLTGICYGNINRWVDKSKSACVKKSKFSELAIVAKPNLFSSKKTRNNVSFGIKTAGDLIVLGRNGNKVLGLGIGDITRLLCAGIL